MIIRKGVKMSLRGAKVVDGNIMLYHILQETHGLIHSLGRNSLLKVLSRKDDMQRASWMRVSLELEAFLENPAKNYTRFVNVLEKEKNKCSCTKYAQKLSDLEMLVKRGPKFYLDDECTNFLQKTRVIDKVN